MDSECYYTLFAVAAEMKVLDPDPAQSNVFSDEGQIVAIYCNWTARGPGAEPGELILMSPEQTNEVKLTTLGRNLPNTTRVCCVMEAKLANRPSSLW